MFKYMVIHTHTHTHTHKTLHQMKCKKGLALEKYIILKIPKFRKCPLA